MVLKRNLIAWLTISWITQSTSVFYNQPKLYPNITWNINATTFANKTIVNSPSHGFFIDIFDTIYFPNNAKNSVLVWTINSINFLGNLTVALPQYTSLFVTVNRDIYFENGNQMGRIDKWKLNETSSEFVTKFNGSCYGLFIDINNTLYCSMQKQHQVVSFSNSTNTFVTVAGNGSNGAALNQLYQPWGIFVDVNFDLYVADESNSRIQLFPQGQLNGTTVAGAGIPNGLTLNLPTDVVLDADGYLFIADNKNNRIIRAGLIDYYCVAGCSNSSGSTAYQLHNAYSLRFDSQGNIYVADEQNSRIQKFMLATNSCDTPIETTNLMVTSTVTGDPTTATTIVETTTIQADRHSFLPPPCSDPSHIGTTCNTSNTRCDMMQPCQNKGTCQNNETKLHDYSCSCPSDFNGKQCQFDHRVCKTNTCWNNGTCVDLQNKTFLCQCEEGWKGTHCEIMVNYCDNITCLNNGICHRLFRSYKCECLGDSFSGEHCEITAMKIQMYRIASKSFAYVGIIAMISVAIFIVIMDVLKYCFGIDPVHKERERLRRKKQAKKRKPVIQRFVYVHAPAPSPTKQLASTTEETVV